MDVSAIVARLDANAPSLLQVIAPNSGGSYTPISTQDAIVTLFQGLVANRMYPLQLPESPVHPSIVYQQVSLSPSEFEGYDITQTDSYVLNVRGYDYDALRTLYASMVAAIAGENIEITDVLHDYDQAENLYRINVQIEYTYLAAAAQTLPAAFVYPVDRSGTPSAFDNFTKQRIDAEYAILVITTAGNMAALQNEIQAALLGWQQGADYHEIEYATGVAVEGVGGLEMWRETYRDAYYMTQA